MIDPQQSVRGRKRKVSDSRQADIKSFTLGVIGLGGGRRVAPGRGPGADGAPHQAGVWAVEAAVGDPETM